MTTCGRELCPSLTGNYVFDDRLKRLSAFCNYLQKGVAKNTHGYKRLPDEVYRGVEYIPSTVRVMEHHIAVYADKRDSNIVKAAPPPSRLLPRNLVTSSIASAVMSAKYVNAVPLNRFSQELERKILIISRQVLARWILKLSEVYFSLIYDAMHRKLLESKLIHK